MVHTPRYAQITATGRYVPERSVDNAEIERILGEPVDEWLVKNVGIRRRHFMAPGENTSDLAVPAARQALERAGDGRSCAVWAELAEEFPCTRRGRAARAGSAWGSS